MASLTNRVKKPLALLLCGGLLSALLVGCASQAPRLQPADTQLNRQLLEQHWQTAGKLAIRSNEQADDAIAQALRFDWHQQTSGYRLTLSGALGFGRVTITQQDQHIQLTQGKRTAIADNIDQLFLQQTGLALPVSYMRYWALGLPAPSQRHAISADAIGDRPRIAGFSQDGWQVSYPKVLPVDRYLLPEKMIASNARFKIVVAFKHWQL